MKNEEGDLDWKTDDVKKKFHSISCLIEDSNYILTLMYYDKKMVLYALDFINTLVCLIFAWVNLRAKEGICDNLRLR